MSKRTADGDVNLERSLVSVSSTKRNRPDDGADGGESARTIVRSSEGAIIASSASRTSNLEAPTMALTGHQAAVTGVCFAPNGEWLVSSGFDGRLHFWNVFGPIECRFALQAHKIAALSVKVSGDSSAVLSTSADKTAAVWDAESGERIKKCRDHSDVVSDGDWCSEKSNLFATCSDDGRTLLWDLRVSRSVAGVPSRYQSLSVAYSKDGTLVYTSGIQNEVSVYDTRRMDSEGKERLFTLEGHRESVTGISLSQDSSYLLSFSRDNSVRVWDAKPFSQRANRCLKIFAGAVHNADNNLIRCGWAPSGAMVASGSADRFVYVWDTTSRKVLYKLPGHTGVVNQVTFHPSQPVIASCGADKRVFLGEINPNSD